MRAPLALPIMYIRVLILIVCLKLCQCQTQNGNGFYGTVELVKNGRRSRLLSDFVDGASTSVAPSPAVTEPPQDAIPKAPIVASSKIRTQTTERMLKNYGNIFQLDPKNLTDKQRVLLERIVERVARLGGSLEPENTVPSVGQDQEQVESRARHRNRNVRKNQPKVAQDEPRSESTAHTVTAAGLDASASAPASTTKTIKRTTVGVIAHPTKAVSSSTTKIGKSKVTQASAYSQLRPNATEIVMGNITTTSIVDSLSKDNAREDLYNRRPIIAEKANVKVSIPRTTTILDVWAFSTQTQTYSFLFNDIYNYTFHSICSMHRNWWSHSILNSFS